MSQHTPGPWVVVDGHYSCFKEVSGLSFKISAVMWASDLTDADYDKRSADLNLIAAAPDLLEALEMALDELMDAGFSAEVYGRSPVSDALILGTKVIAKAKGKA